MTFMRWLHWVSSMKSTKRKEPASAPIGDDDPSQTTPDTVRVDLGSSVVLTDAVQCARHALVMEFRAKYKFDPNHVDLADWVNSIWFDRGHIRGIIRSRNAMALSLGERSPDFWDELKTVTTNATATPPGQSPR